MSEWNKNAVPVMYSSHCGPDESWCQAGDHFLLTIALGSLSFPKLISTVMHALFAVFAILMTENYLNVAYKPFQQSKTLWLHAT